MAGECPGGQDSILGTLMEDRRVRGGTRLCGCEVWASTETQGGVRTEGPGSGCARLGKRCALHFRSPKASEMEAEDTAGHSRPFCHDQSSCLYLKGTRRHFLKRRPTLS